MQEDMVYPTGCRPVTDDLGPDELIRRLKVYYYLIIFEILFINFHIIFFRLWLIHFKQWVKMKACTNNIFH